MNAGGVAKACKSKVRMSDFRFRISDFKCQIICYNEIMQDVNDLIIYQNALKLLQPMYKLINLLPLNEFKLRSQIWEAAKSIAPLITEGFAKKRSQNEYKRFLLMALGSSDEVITHLREIKIINFPNVKAETCEALIKYYKIESKQINKHISVIISNQKSEI